MREYQSQCDVLPPIPTPRPEQVLPLEWVEHHGWRGVWGRPLKQTAWTRRRNKGELTNIDTNVLVEISRLAHRHRMVAFSYVNNRGERGEHVVEPYSLRVGLKDLLLFAYDPGDAHIKSFYMYRIRALRSYGQNFVPRWRIEFPIRLKDERIDYGKVSED